MAVARSTKFPNVRHTGTSGLPCMTVFCSDQAHFSAQKNSMVLGIGSDNCIAVKSDNRGKMVVSELKRAVDEAKNKVIKLFLLFCLFLLEETYLL